MFAPVGLFGVLLLGRNDCRKKIAQHTVLAMLMITFLLLVGCSGTSAGTHGPTPQAGATRPGTYNLTVVGSCEKAQHSVSLTLTVQ